MLVSRKIEKEIIRSSLPCLTLGIFSVQVLYVSHRSQSESVPCLSISESVSILSQSESVPCLSISESASILSQSENVPY